MDQQLAKEIYPVGKLAAALAKAQGEIRNAKKDADNPFFKSKYADLASVWDACREALSKNEIAVIQAPCIVDGKLCIRTKLIHSSGEFEEGLLPIAVPITAKAQEMGSAITYARRYSLQSMVGVAPEEGEDDDGNAASNRHLAQPQQQPQEPPQQAPEAPAPQSTPAKSDGDTKPITTGQRKMLYAKMKEAGLSQEECKSLFDFVGAKTSKAASAFIENLDKAIADWRTTTATKTQDLPEDTKEEDVPW